MCDALPDIESDTTSTQITLTDGFGKMSKRTQQAVIRKYNKDTDSSNWYRAKLMLYYPWFDEQADLLGGYPSYEAHYRHVCYGAPFVPKFKIDGYIINQPSIY
jgi:hypothetical protein